MAVCDGDSLTASGATWCNNVGLITVPSNAVSNFQFTPTYYAQDQGSQGTGVAALLAQANHNVDPFYRPSASNNAVVVWAGTNDGNALASLPLLRGYCTARRMVGWKCIVGTMISRTGSDNTKNLLDTLLRQHWFEFADGLADFAANPNIGADGASANATYFTDGIHLTTTGNNIVTAIAKRSVSRVYGNSSGVVQTAPPQFQFVQGASALGGTTCVFPSNNGTGNLLFVAALANNGGATINTPTDTRTNTYSSVSAAVSLAGRTCRLSLRRTAWQVPTQSP